MQIRKLLCCMQHPINSSCAIEHFPALRCIVVFVPSRVFLAPIFFVLGCFFDEGSCSCEQDEQGCQKCCGCKGVWALFLMVISPAPMILLLSGTSLLEIWCGLRDQDTMAGATTYFPWNPATDSPVTANLPVFDVVEGECSLSTFTAVTNASHNISYPCVQSPNYPLSYSSEQNCAVVLKSLYTFSTGYRIGGSLTAVDLKTDPADELWMVFNSPVEDYEYDSDHPSFDIETCNNYYDFLTQVPVDAMDTLSSARRPQCMSLYRTHVMHFPSAREPFDDLKDCGNSNYHVAYSMGRIFEFNSPTLCDSAPPLWQFPTVFFILTRTSGCIPACISVGLMPGLLDCDIFVAKIAPCALWVSPPPYTSQGGRASFSVTKAAAFQVKPLIVFGLAIALTPRPTQSQPKVM